MSTDNIENPKDKPKLIICKNCHQEILEEKMFLHEGFCLRNNIFCEHCEKIFLKEDYNEHIKSIQKNLDNKKMDSQSHSQRSPETCSESVKPNSFKEHNDNINNRNENIEEIFNNPSIEVVQMPPTEFFHINKPIIISEYGQIVSNNNQNQFLLPYLEINPFQINPKNEQMLDEIINNDEIFKENNIINRNSYKIEDLHRLLSSDKINSHNNLNNNLNFRDNYNSKTSLANNRRMNLRLTEKINYNQKNSIKSKNMMNYTDSNINNNLLNRNKNTFGLNNEAKNKILPYKNKERIQDFNKQQVTPKKQLLNNSVKNSTFNRKLFEKMPIENNSINSHIQINNSFNSIFVNKFSNNKEPKDSNSKKFDLNQSSEKKTKLNIPFKLNSTNGKNNITIKRCKFCNSMYDAKEEILHYRNCLIRKQKKKKISKLFNIPKPKNNKAFLIENNVAENNNESIIDLNKRKTLHRQFNTTLNVISLNNEAKDSGILVYNSYNKTINDNIIKVNKKISVKKKLFKSKEKKNKKKDFPEDSKRTEKKSKAKRRIKRNNNKSVDISNTGLIHTFMKDIKIQKMPTQQIFQYDFNENNEPLIYFNNTYHAKNSSKF